MDVKPANIYESPSGLLKLGDFGHARVNKTLYIYTQFVFLHAYVGNRAGYITTTRIYLHKSCSHKFSS